MKKSGYISLTSQNSHSINIESGQGSFAFGFKHLEQQNKFDAYINPDEPINWDCFNEFYTPHGANFKDLNPYGDWPRWFYFYGNDTGFAKWASKRAIENFSWQPDKAVKLNLTESKIQQLTVVATKYPIEITLGTHLNTLALSGKLSLFKINATPDCKTALSFFPKNHTASNQYTLPKFTALTKVTSVSIDVNPLGKAFNCDSLTQFTDLNSLQLSGNMGMLSSLAKHPNLNSLALRFCPNLEGLPPLSTWQNLDTFIGFNIEETQGKILRGAVRKMEKNKPMKFASVSQLRKPIWFTTEYGMPFNAWETKQAKTAVKAYKKAVKALKKANTKQAVESEIKIFLAEFEKTPSLETTEREAIAEAVMQLIQVPNLKTDNAQGMAWFYEADL